MNFHTFLSLVYMYVQIYLLTEMYIYISVHMYIYIVVHTYIHEWVHKSTYVHTYVCMLAKFTQATSKLAYLCE